MQQEPALVENPFRFDIMSEIVNKIKQSKLETVDLEAMVRDEPISVLDIRPFLFQDLILKEKEFREHIQAHDWSQYEGAWLGIVCSVDALIPAWAWMLVAVHASPYAKDVIFGDKVEVEKRVLQKKIETFDWEIYRDRFVLLKGCSKMDLSPDTYLEATKKLLPIAKKVMYGEACSNVPVYRAGRK